MTDRMAAAENAVSLAVVSHTHIYAVHFCMVLGVSHWYVLLLLLLLLLRIIKTCAAPSPVSSIQQVRHMKRANLRPKRGDPPTRARLASYGYQFM
jgi:hypothetical protein